MTKSSALRQPADEPVDPAPGEVPADGLWRLILRAWCGSSLEQVCAQIGSHCELDTTQIEATVLGLMNDSIRALPCDVAAAFEAAFGQESEAEAKRGEDEMRSANGRAALEQDPGDLELVTPGGSAPPASPLLREDAASDGRLPEAPRRRNWPFPCEEEGCDGGFDTAQGLRMHHLRRHEGKGGSGQPRRGGRKPPKVNGRRAEILGAAERSNDAETEAVAVCARHLARLTDPEAKRVLEYLAQRFVVDAGA